MYHQVRVSNQTFGLHKVKLVSSSDHVIVPRLANTTDPDAAIAQLNDGNDATLSLFYAASPVQLGLDGGAAGDTVWFVTRHAGRLNYMPEV